MSLSTLTIVLLLAFGVSMDAFAVSISNGLCYDNSKTPMRQIAISTAATFGIFQGLMPLLGFLAGALFRTVAESIDHWIALLLLGFIGGKMIYDAVQEIRNPEEFVCPPFNGRTLLVQGIATSVDAFAVGIGLAMDNVNIVITAPIIALFTFVFSFIGVYVGQHFGKVIGDKAQIVGGVILIGIGVNIFLSHTL